MWEWAIFPRLRKDLFRNSKTSFSDLFFMFGKQKKHRTLWKEVNPSLPGGSQSSPEDLLFPEIGRGGVLASLSPVPGVTFVQICGARHVRPLAQRDREISTKRNDPCRNFSQDIPFVPPREAPGAGAGAAASAGIFRSSAKRSFCASRDPRGPRPTDR